MKLKGNVYITEIEHGRAAIEKFFDGDAPLGVGVQSSAERARQLGVVSPEAPRRPSFSPRMLRAMHVKAARGPRSGPTHLHGPWIKAGFLHRCKRCGLLKTIPCTESEMVGAFPPTREDGSYYKEIEIGDNLVLRHVDANVFQLVKVSAIDDEDPSWNDFINIWAWNFGPAVIAMEELEDPSEDDLLDAVHKLLFYTPRPRYRKVEER